MLLALVLGVAHAGDVLINEVLYDPSGSDDGLEWIEICNAGSETFDLTDWTIENAGSSWTEVWTFTGGTLAPGDYLLVGYGSVDFSGSFSPNLQNGGSETDGLRLLDGDGTVLDTLLYDSPNTNGLVDDSGSVGTSFAVDAGEAKALFRWPDCADTDASGVDFDVTSSPTPGDSNDGGGSDGGGSDGGGDTGGACVPGAGVVINEFVANPPGADADALAEWVELYNTTAEPVDVSGWTLEWGTSGYTRDFGFPSDTVIEAGGFLVVGESNADGVDLDVGVTMALGNATSNADALRLVDCDGAVLDTVIYGSVNEGEDDWTDDSGSVATSLADKPAEGSSVGRIVDGTDTDLCGDDFTTWDPPSPGTANGTVPECPGQHDVKINEFLPNPADADDPADEWVELVNAGSDTVDLSGWQLQWGTGSYGSSVTIPDGVTLEAGGFFVIGGIGVPEVDLVPDTDAGDSELKLGNATSDADAVRLVHCGGGAADTVVYGPANEGEEYDNWLDDGGGVATSLAPTPEEGFALARFMDGLDTDQCGQDFTVAETNTPGGSNPEITPPVCSPGSLTIKINELFPNPAGTDTDNEWVELVNTGTETQRLDSWTIETATSSWGVDFTFPGGAEIAPGAFLLVGGPLVPETARDFEAESLGLGNAGTAPDGVRLADCEGTLQDTVLYGDAGDEPDDELLDDAGEQTMAAMPDDNFSVGRFPDGVDTDDNASDFLGNMPPTPGAANAEPSAGGGGVGSTPDKGCGKGCVSRTPDGDAPDASAEPGRCGVVGPSGGLHWLVIAVVAALRRRHER